MGKILCILFTGIMILSISGCGNSDNEMPILSNTEQINEILTTQSPTNIPTAQSITETTSEPAPIPKTANITGLFEELETDNTAIIEEVYYYSLEHDAERIRDTFCIRFTGEDYENQMDNYLNKYLKNNGFGNLEPENVYYLRDGIKCEYYVGNEDLCFVIYENNFRQHDSGSLDIIIMRNAFLMKTGEIIYSYNQKRDVYREAYYDINGERQEAVEYYYRQGLSFPVISKYEYNNKTPRDPHILQNVLIRNERFAYQEHLFGYDEYGNINEYKGCLGSKHGIENGCEPPCGLEAGVSVEYENDMKSVVEYTFGTDSGHGSSDSAGTTYYDEYGRMVYRTYYVTSGGFTCFYLYKNGENRPWVCAAYGGMPQSGGDNYVYGQSAFIYLFK